MVLTLVRLVQIFFLFHFEHVCLSNDLAVTALQHYSNHRLQHGPDQIPHGPAGVHTAAGEL